MSEWPWCSWVFTGLSSTYLQASELTLGKSGTPSWDTLAALLAVELGTAEVLWIQILPTDSIDKEAPCLVPLGLFSPHSREKMVCLGLLKCQSSLPVSSGEHRASLTQTCSAPVPAARA